MCVCVHSALNQDSMGVQARKLAVGGSPVGWLVGLEPCSSAPAKSYSRALQRTSVTDNRQWSVRPLASNKEQYSIRSLSTGRCLAVAAVQAADEAPVPPPASGLSGGVVLLVPPPP